MTRVSHLEPDGERAARRLAPVPVRPVRWLHLSDFHFEGLQSWQSRPTLRALLRHAENLKKEELAPDLVFITGDVAKVLGDELAMGLLGRRLEEFYAFTERLLGPARGWRAERPCRCDVREIGGVRIGIMQLNSAWASGSLDDRRLLIGEEQVRAARDEIADALLRIVLVHHPIDALWDVDRRRIERNLERNSAARKILYLEYRYSLHGAPRRRRS
ncbi:MAG: metallophosphoesterase [bacterium]|nr:metallophosphoesterase [bacterium]